MREVPESAPHAVRVVMGVKRLPVLTQGNLPDCFIVLNKLSVCIIGDTSAEQGVLKSGIEFCLVLVTTALYLDAP